MTASANTSRLSGSPELLTDKQSCWYLSALQLEACAEITCRLLEISADCLTNGVQYVTATAILIPGIYKTS